MCKSFVLISLLEGINRAQTLIPSQSYKLHANEERSQLGGTGSLPSIVIALDHEHNLLILVPQADGEWVLKRLNDWDSKTLSEDTLQITGEKGRGNQVFIETDLTLSRDGRYALVRINYRSGAIEATERNRSAVITLIDMKSFAVLSRRTTTTTDPLIADINGSSLSTTISSRQEWKSD